MARERMLTTRKTGIAAAIALTIAVLLCAAWMVTLLFPRVGDIIPGPSVPVTPAPASPSAVPSPAPSIPEPEPSVFPLGDDGRLDWPPQQG